MQVWGYSNEALSFVTYDNVWTAQSKSRMAKTKQLGGVMFWELDGDSLKQSESLIYAAKGVFSSANEPEESPKHQSNSQRHN